MTDALARSAWLRIAAAAVGAGTCAAPVPVIAQPTKLHVGLGLIEPHGSGYYAADRGLFKKAGLDVELRQYQLGAIVAEAVAAGEMQIGSSGVFSMLAGRQHGIPFVLISPGPIFDVADPAPELLVVARDSPIRSVADLNGKVIGCNSVGGQEQLAVSAFIDKNGGDSTTVKWLAVTPGVMVAALEQGRIAAGDLQEPMLTTERDRVRSLGNHYTGIASRFLTTAWFTTDDWLAKNKDAARRFNEAIVAAGQWSMANPEAAAAILQKYTGFKATRATMRYVTKLDPAMVQPMIDVAAKYKMLAPMKASDMMWNGK